MRKLAMTFVMLWALVASRAGAANKPFEVDVQLVLLNDASTSMDIGELAFQKYGYIEAIKSSQVLRAIHDGALGRIAVTYVTWSGPNNQTTIVPWMLVDGEASAQAFANALDAVPVGNMFKGTSESGALAFAAAAFERSGFVSERRVIDISGDGKNNDGPPVEVIRDALVKSGIVINGLPLMMRTLQVSYAGTVAPDLDAYYKACVTGGGGSFVIPVTDIRQFTPTLLRKLEMEISRSPVALPATEAAMRSPYDCATR